MPELYVLGKSRPDGQVALELARAIRFSARKVVEELRGLRADIREALDGTTDGLEALHEGLAAMTDEDPGCGEG
jgi:hypothetical protein